MPKRSVFRDFIGVLRKHWATELPALRPIKAALDPRMPKTSTFYAGVAHPLGLHVFVNSQHSCMAWQVGQFTINFILSKSEGPPEFWGGPWAPNDRVSFTEGSYRVSSMLDRHRDKWWHLKHDAPPIITEAWRPTSYDDYDAVLAQAAVDVTNEVRQVLVKLGVS